MDLLSLRELLPATSPEEQQQVTRIGLAALLHDVGKFAQRAEADPETSPTLSNLHEFGYRPASEDELKLADSWRNHVEG